MRSRTLVALATVGLVTGTVTLGACHLAPEPSTSGPTQGGAPDAEPEAGQPASPDRPGPGPGPEPEPEPEPEPIPPPPTRHPEVPEPDPDAERDPAAARRHFERGVEQVLRGRGAAAAAASAFADAARADGDCAKCYWELGWALQLQDDWIGCVVAWDHVAAIEPDFPEHGDYYPTAVAHRDLAWRLANTEAPAVPEPEVDPVEGPTLRIAAVGDVTMGRGWPEPALPSAPDDLFADVRGELEVADLVFGNLETVLADDGESTKCGDGQGDRCFAFRVPTGFASALSGAGFDLMSIANNHAGDFGPRGRASTIAALDGVGILHSGPVDDIAIVTTDGRSLAMIAFGTGPGSYRLTELDVATRVVAELALAHDIVIVSFHGGAEGAAAQRVPDGTELYLGEDRGDLRRFTHAVVDAGADLVLGHGPHVLRGVERYRGRLIAYSLGNFSGWRTFGLDGPSGISAVLRVELAPNGVALAAELVPLRLVPPGRPEPDPERAAIELVRELSRQDFGSELFDARGRWQR